MHDFIFLLSSKWVDRPTDIGGGETTRTTDEGTDGVGRETVVDLPWLVDHPSLDDPELGSILPRRSRLSLRVFTDYPTSRWIISVVCIR
jgi:hypothetical protein